MGSFGQRVDSEVEFYFHRPKPLVPVPDPFRPLPSRQSVCSKQSKRSTSSHRSHRSSDDPLLALMARMINETERRDRDNKAEMEKTRAEMGKREHDSKVVIERREQQAQQQARLELENRYLTEKLRDLEQSAALEREKIMSEYEKLVAEKSASGEKDKITTRSKPSVQELSVQRGYIFTSSQYCSPVDMTDATVSSSRAPHCRMLMSDPRQTQRRTLISSLRRQPHQLSTSSRLRPSCSMLISSLRPTLFCSRRWC